MAAAAAAAAAAAPSSADIPATRDLRGIGFPSYHPTLDTPATRAGLQHGCMGWRACGHTAAWGAVRGCSLGVRSAPCRLRWQR